HMLIEDMSEWGGELVCDDGSFVACDDEVKDTVVMRSNLSSAVAGGEGLFNLCLKGNGYAVIKSPVPRNELIEMVLENDVVKIDGDNAIAWSNSLKFTVERSSKSLLGSAVNGEGLVNVYRGTGKILVAPLTRDEAKFTGTGFIKT
ncbi:MAG: AIM24 family protein, partial [Firmicutes bacterium]|nr:AIM24 family protein [Bacillota bacterium]